MVKKVLILFLFLFGTLSFGAGEYDKDLVLRNQSRNDKVKIVFKQMMDAYQEGDISKFFSYVSENRFEQDYMTFYDAIDEDIRIYDILSVDTWVNKINEDGVKRFLEVQWEKRYESSKAVKLNEENLARSDEYEIFQRGTTQFLFDEIKGKYKLIKIAGNNFWGGSLEEWKEEVGDISGQESKEIAGDNVNGEYQNGGQSSSGGLADLTIDCCMACDGIVKINNIGDGGTIIGYVEYYDDGGTLRAYHGNIPAGMSVVTGRMCPGGSTLFKVNPNHVNFESNYNNNDYQN